MHVASTTSGWAGGDESMVLVGWGEGDISDGALNEMLSTLDDCLETLGCDITDDSLLGERRGGRGGGGGAGCRFDAFAVLRGRSDVSDIWAGSSSDADVATGVECPGLPASFFFGPLVGTFRFFFGGSTISSEDDTPLSFHSIVGISRDCSLIP
jgi:hypothetical protein